MTLVISHKSHATSIYSNDREGKSIYLQRRTFFGKWILKRRLAKFIQNHPQNKIEEFINQLNPRDQLCEETFVNEINSFFNGCIRYELRRIATVPRQCLGGREASFHTFGTVQHARAPA